MCLVKPLRTTLSLTQLYHGVHLPWQTTQKHNERRTSWDGLLRTNSSVMYMRCEDEVTDTRTCKTFVSIEELSRWISECVTYSWWSLQGREVGLVVRRGRVYWNTGKTFRYQCKRDHSINEDTNRLRRMTWPPRNWDPCHRIRRHVWDVTKVSQTGVIYDSLLTYLLTYVTLPLDPSSLYVCFLFHSRSLYTSLSL